MNNNLTNRAADNIRTLSMAMVEKAKSGHPGGAMGGADFINVLYSEYLRFDPDNPEWFFRDRFFLDPGHMSPMLYAVLSFFGFYSRKDLEHFRQWKSVTPGHPEKDFKRMIENTSGPLGQGHAMAVGAAIAERMMVSRFGDWTAHNIFTFISDGGIQEEISQGAGRIAGHLGLGNLIMFFDSNDIQLSTETQEAITEDTAAKYEAWGWQTTTIDGNNPDEIRLALDMAVAEKEKPFLIIGKTVMGKGLIAKDGSSFERKVSTHGQPVSKAGADVEASMQNLNADMDDYFAVFDETRQLYDMAADNKRKEVANRKLTEQRWRKTNPEKAALLDDYIHGNLSGLDFEAIEQPADAPTRNTSGAVLSYFSAQLNNMLVASADLSASDKTEGFLKNSYPIAKQDFSGGFLHAGVSEMTMGAVANGIALHGGIIPVTGTFFVFSDYMKPVMRLSALMELPVKFLFTHDAFRVGEDGPTHQPVEQEAQIRLLEKVKNHSGRRSVLVLRPADGAETRVAWKMAMENNLAPTVLILSRQKIKDIPALETSRFREALQAEKGAYIVKNCQGQPDIVLAANGSEVATLMDAAKMLEDQNGLKIRVVSAISDALFFDQSPEYRESVIPSDVPVFGLTAGVPLTLRELVGPNGQVFGMTHFGYSAPFDVLDEKFGFTAPQVAAEILNFLNNR